MQFIRKMNDIALVPQIILGALLLMNGYTGSVYITLLIQIYIMIFAVVIDADKSILLYLMVAFNSNLLSASYLILTFGYLLVLLFKINFKISQHIVKYSGLFFIYLFMSFLMHDGIHTDYLNYVFRIVCELLICFIIVEHNYYNKIKTGVLFSFVFLAIQTFILGDLMYGSRMSPINSNPNYLGGLMGIAILVCILNIDKSIELKSNVYLVIYLLLFGLFVYCGALTLSRSFLVTAVVEIALFVLSKVGLSLRKIIFLILLLTMVFLSYKYFLVDAINVIIKRIASDETGGSGRLEIWMKYFKEWKYSLWYMIGGIGFNETHNWITNNNIPVGNVHNLFVEILTTKGIFGTLIYLFVYVKGLMFDNRKIKNHNKMKRIILATFICSFMFESGIDSFYRCWQIYIFIILYLTVNNEVNDKEKMGKL